LKSFEQLDLKSGTSKNIELLLMVWAAIRNKLHTNTNININSRKKIYVVNVVRMVSRGMQRKF